MIERIIEASARNKFLIFIFTVFAIAGGIYGLMKTPLDAIPDLSDVQVIIYTDWEGRSPDLVEDQVTYPISTRFIAAPKVKFVRGESMFGKSFVYVIFEDGTDIYWARSRVIEYLNSVRGSLPEGVNPVIGPDATGVGWVYEYALVDDTGKHDLAELRSLQDWHLRYSLESVKGVAEVAPVGGFVKQYQVDLDPNALVAYGIPLADVVSAIKMSNGDVGGKIFEVATTEYYVRGRGYIKKVEDIENVGLKVVDGTPIYVKNVGTVHLGGDLRRGVAELDGKGEVVGGIVVMRYGENALNVIDGIKKKMEEIKASLPAGVRIVPTYDRSELIVNAIHTLREKLIEESIVVALVCLVFLWHVRSALVAIITLPIAIILSFLPMFYLGLTSNIMSLGGIAIAIGAMVDAAIIMVENAHKALEHFQEKHGRDPDRAERVRVIVEAAKSVGRPLFFSLLVITVSFIPVFSLTAQEGRLFKPLAFTKTFAMFFAAILGITVVPVLMLLLVRGRITPEIKNPVNRFLIWAYQPFVNFVLRFRWLTLGAAVLVLIATIYPYLKLGKEFMPPLNEGTILYMPTAVPGMSINEATKILQIQDRMLAKVPEVERVFGKAGQSETPTDPRAAGHVRDGRDAQAARAMAAGHDVGKAARGDERTHQDAGHGEHLLDADPNADGDAHDRLPLNSRDQSFRSRPEADRKRRRRYREGAGRFSEYAERLRRAHDGRLLPRFRREPRSGGSLWPARGGCERHCGDGDRRQDHRDHGGGARALSHQRPLCAGFSRRSRFAQARAGGGADGGILGEASAGHCHRASPDLAAGQYQLPDRPAFDSQ